LAIPHGREVLKKTMNTLRRIFIGAVLSTVAAGFASATSIGCANIAAFTVAAGTSSICNDATVNPTAINWSQGLSINQFDPTFGTLNYVEIIAWANGTVTESVSNHSATTAESFTSGIATVNLAFSGTGFTTITMTPSASGLSGGPIAANGLFVSDPQTINADTTAGGGLFISLPFLLSPFEGTGTIGSLTAAGGPSSAGGSGGPDLFYNANGSVGGTLAVLYDYTPPPSGVPEPATMALMGGAMIGLGMIGKRLKKS
jgi:hypothetical protein